MCHEGASGELVCFGYNEDGQCEVAPGFKVLLGPRTSSAPEPNPTEQVLMPVHYEEPPADISEEEGAAIVAEQEVSWTERNIGAGWHGTELHSQLPAAFTPAQADGCRIEGRSSLEGRSAVCHVSQQEACFVSFGFCGSECMLLLSCAVSLESFALSFLRRATPELRIVRAAK